MSCLLLPDISLKKAVGKCDLKCSFSYKYPDISQCILTHNSDYISGAISASRDQVQAIYQDKNYMLREFRIYSPSIHNYDGKKQACELFLIHSSLDGSADLLVCFPIIENSGRDSSGGDASSLLVSIVDEISTYAPEVGETSNLTWTNPVNWKVLYPTNNTSFLTYTANLPFDECATSTSVSPILLYPVSTSLAQLSTDKIDSLNHLITHFSDDNINDNTNNNEESYPLYLQPKGAGTTFHSDPNVYIDCQPVWESEEQITPDSTPTTTGINIKYYPLIFFILSVAIIIFFLYLISMGLSKLTKSSSP